MSFETSTRLASGVAIVSGTGDLVSGPATEALGAVLRDTFEHESQRILFDCQGVEAVDSAGMGELVSAYTSIVKRGGGFKLLRPQKRLRDLLGITRLDGLFEVCDDEGTAVAGFSSASMAQAQRALSDYLE